MGTIILILPSLFIKSITFSPKLKKTIVVSLVLITGNVMLKYFDALEVPAWAEWLAVIVMGIIFGCMFALAA